MDRNYWINKGYNRFKKGVLTDKYNVSTVEMDFKKGINGRIYKKGILKKLFC